MDVISSWSKRISEVRNVIMKTPLPLFPLKIYYALHNINKEVLNIKRFFHLNLIRETKIKPSPIMYYIAWDRNAINIQCYHPPSNCLSSPKQSALVSLIILLKIPYSLDDTSLSNYSKSPIRYSKT